MYVCFGIFRHPIQITEKRYHTRPVFVINLIEQNGNGGVIPTIEDNNQVVEKEMGVHLPSLVILLQPPFDVFETIEIFIKIVLCCCCRIVIMLDSKKKEIILVQFIKSHIMQIL